MRRKKILFMVESITLAQVVRAAVLAKGLNPNQYEVHFASGSFDPMVFHGTDFGCWPLRTIDARRASRDLERGRRLYDVSTLEGYVADELSIMQAIAPDLVVGDFRLSLAISAPTYGVPHITLINGYWSPFALRDQWPLPDHPLVDLAGDELARRYFPKAMPYAFSHFAAPINAMRGRYRLPPVGDLLEVLTYGSQTLYLDAAELIPTSTLPPTHQFLGPVQWAPPIPLDPEIDRRMASGPPTVYVTLGSSGRSDRLPLVLEALEPLPIQVVVATAGRSEVKRVPENATLVPFVPGDEVARRSALVISNGGSTTGYQALACGTPVLGLPSNLDQALAAQAITNAGAGAAIRAGASTVETIRAAAWQLLHPGSHRTAAQNVAQVFAGYDPHARFAECVSQLTHKSSGRAA